jgi:hypothetical protein
MSCENKLPPWEKPSPLTITHDVGLNIMNSLTRSKDKFITMDGGKQIRWYMYVGSSLRHEIQVLGLVVVLYNYGRRLRLVHQCPPSYVVLTRRLLLMILVSSGVDPQFMLHPTWVMLERILDLILSVVFLLITFTTTLRLL